MRIGVDIDGVVADSYPFWLGELNRHYGKEIKELYAYEMHLIFDVPWEDMNQFFIQNVEKLFLTPLPMPGVKKAFDLLRGEGHEIYLVTARREVEEEITTQWLLQHGICYDQLMVVGERNKAEVCRQESIELFIEDYHLNAKLIAEAGVRVLILDAPYNRIELPNSIVRCYNWNQIIEAIHKSQEKGSRQT